MHNTQSRLPVNDNDVVTLIATIGTFEAVVVFFFNADLCVRSYLQSRLEGFTAFSYVL